VWVNAGFVGGMHVVGKIAFNPKEVLGRGSEGTFVYRFVQHMTRRLEQFLFMFIPVYVECKDDADWVRQSMYEH